MYKLEGEADVVKRRESVWREWTKTLTGFCRHSYIRILYRHNIWGLFIAGQRIETYSIKNTCLSFVECQSEIGIGSPSTYEYRSASRETTDDTREGIILIAEAIDWYWTGMEGGMEGWETRKNDDGGGARWNWGEGEGKKRTVRE